MLIRPAVHADIPAIAALVAPEVRAGTLLPRAIDPVDFLVAPLPSRRGRPSRLAGVVGIWAVTPRVAELGSLVAAVRGQGVGSALVEAAMAGAAERGFEEVIALSGSPEFFERLGFAAVPDAPNARARGCRASPQTPEVIGEAAEARAHVCAACPRLATCTQSMLARTAAEPASRRAVA